MKIKELIIDLLIKSKGDTNLHFMVDSGIPKRIPKSCLKADKGFILLDINKINELLRESK